MLHKKHNALCFEVFNQFSLRSAIVLGLFYSLKLNFRHLNVTSLVLVTYIHKDVQIISFSELKKIYEGCDLTGKKKEKKKKR